MSKQPQSTILGSVWNQAGTWEERNLNSWASSRIKELLSSLGSLEFSGGKASIDEVSKCSGDYLDTEQAFLVTVRNKKRVGYAYELTLKFKGEWLIQEEKKIKGHLDIPEFSFGELDDLQIEVRLSDEKGLSMEDRMRICKDLSYLVRLFAPNGFSDGYDIEEAIGSKGQASGFNGKNAEMVTEATVGTSMEVIPISSLAYVVLETEANLPKESKGGAIKAFGSFNSTDAVGTVEPYRVEVLSLDIFSMRIQEEVPQTSSVPSSFFNINNLRVTTDFLRRHLPLVDRLTLEGEDVQHQVSRIFNSLALLSHYLTSFIGAAFGFSPLELVEAKNELEKLKYYLEKEKAANADLIKEIDCSEKVLFKAQEVIDRKNDELSRACRRIEVLEKQRLEADRECHRAYEIIRCLKRTLAERGGSSSEIILL
ncbi:hypothetical protein COCNU_11G013740 [Cocos nucifera]|uniref:Activator of Hsp90 ATPase AHSA1-like N-terminal domain-containing protein n=1 Tax=Cocos nucifera TaxID=13894 RepID=A0A8K0IQ61_COCNU|nr:hypothetical protein COCNU_11G013740 [Cocos nucifera]